MNIAETDRLILRRFELEDAAFILELVNDPAFLEHIGDRGVRNPEDARRYLRDGPLASYEQFGFGLFRTDLKATGQPIGMCGLLQREYLDDADVGFAFLPAFRRQGYATESARAVLDYGRRTLGMRRILAFTSLENTGSARVLENIGLTYQREFRLPDGETVRLFGPALEIHSS